MILNRSAVDRGLAHALLYKTEMIDLREEKGKKSVLEPEPQDARSKVQQREWSSHEYLGVINEKGIISPASECKVQRSSVKTRQYRPPALSVAGPAL